MGESIAGTETVLWNGRDVFTFQRSGERKGLPWIEGQPLIDDLDLVAQVIATQFPEHVISTTPELGLKIPGEVLRHARVMRHSGHDLPTIQLADGLRFAPLTEADAERYAAAADLGYPPDHPDWQSDQVQQSIDMIHGKVVGPFHPASAIVEAEDGEIIAGALVTKFQGPWLSEFFRVAGAPRDTAGALLVHVITKTGPIGLAVTESNTRAIALYDRVGFTTEEISVTVKTGRSEA